jgi:hypothetical protein
MNQYLYGAEHQHADKPMPWLLYDSWDINLACKVITLGYPVDLDGNGWNGAKNWPLDEWGHHSIVGVREVFDRALGIARASVRAGTIKDPDTPTHWIAWAEGKGYSVTHLREHITEAPSEPIKPVSRSAAQDTSILEAIRSQGHNPMALPDSKSGVKAGIRAKLCETRKDIFQSSRVFDKSWQRLRSQGDIQEAM